MVVVVVVGLDSVLRATICSTTMGMALSVEGLQSSHGLFCAAGRIGVSLGGFVEGFAICFLESISFAYT